MKQRIKIGDDYSKEVHVPAFPERQFSTYTLTVLQIAWHGSDCDFPSTNWRQKWPERNASFFR